jgi:hypothetical protein
MDNRHHDRHAVFRPPMRPEDPPARLRACQNLDLDDAGWPQLRSGTTTRVSASVAGRAVFSAGEHLYFQDGDSLLLVDPDTWATTPVVTELAADRTIRGAVYRNQLWWTNGVVCGCVDGANAYNWGMAVPPPPTLTAGVGDLPAGIYQVAATYLDARGVESGAGRAASITLNGAQSIVANLASNDTNAVSARWYVSGPDTSKTLFYVGATVVDEFGVRPAAITDAKVTRYALRTQWMRGPVPGNGVAVFRDILLTWSDAWLFPSSGLSPHLFRAGHEAFQLPATIQAVAGLASGIWVATTQGLRWLAGDSPAALVLVQRDDRAYAQGSLVLAGSRLPRLETPDPVALFVSDCGLVAGLPSGQAVPLTPDQLLLDDITNQYASLAYHETSDGIRQVLFNLESLT